MNESLANQFVLNRVIQIRNYEVLIIITRSIIPPSTCQHPFFSVYELELQEDEVAASNKSHPIPIIFYLRALTEPNDQPLG